jgi:hypothetical protein
MILIENLFKKLKVIREITFLQCSPIGVFYMAPILKINNRLHRASKISRMAWYDTMIDFSHPNICPNVCIPKID